MHEPNEKNRDTTLVIFKELNGLTVKQLSRVTELKSVIQRIRLYERRRMRDLI